MWPFRRKKENPIKGCVVLAVNKSRELVAFSLGGARGDNQRIFWADAFCESLHYHRGSFTQRTEGKWIPMEKIPVGDTLHEQMALFCKSCGLRLVVPAHGLSQEELTLLFEEWNLYDRTGYS